MSIKIPFLYKENYFYMAERRSLVQLEDVERYPTEYEERSCTDVFCLIVGILFSLIMIIVAASTFSYAKFQKVNFPADENGILCGIDKPGYPYVYFANPPQMERRVCVAECPENDNQPLKCIPTDNVGCGFSNSQGFEVVFYENEAVQTRSGHFCMPTDEKLKTQLLRKSDLENRDSFYNSIDTIVLCFFVALGFSVIYFCLVQFFPKIMNYAAVIVGLILIIATTVCVFTYRTEQRTLKLVLGVILLFILIVIVLNVCKNTDSWRMHAIFLRFSTEMIKKRCLTLVYIPVFFAMLVGFVVILVLEFTAFWTTGNISFDHKKSLYHDLSGFAPVLLTILLVIHAVWGLSFIKEAFNFCVSGQSVLWYYDKNEGFCYPVRLLLCKHLGSVIAGSFMTGFFSFFDFIFDFLKPDENENPDGCYTKAYNCCCLCCVKLFDLVRSDAMAFINLSGNPFCNSARYCEYLCDRSVIMDYSQSTSRAYRICAHFLLGGVMAIFALYIKGNISIYALVVIMVQTLFISTLLISVHADSAEAIQIVFLVDQEFARRKAQDQNSYNHRDMDHNLEGMKLHDDLVQEVREERIFQKRKRGENA